MILGVITTVTIDAGFDDGAGLVAPLVPWPDGVRELPDALTPHHVAQAEGGAVVHDPLGDGFAFFAFALLCGEDVVSCLLLVEKKKVTDWEVVYFAFSFFSFFFRFKGGGERKRAGMAKEWNGLTPIFVTIKSFAMPVQCWLLPEQALLQPISATFPGN